MLDDQDDYITINITLEESAALAVTLMLAAKMGIFDMLPSKMEQKLNSFFATMQKEIQRQKTGEVS